MQKKTQQKNQNKERENKPKQEHKQNPGWDFDAQHFSLMSFQASFLKA